MTEPQKSTRPGAFTFMLILMSNVSIKVHMSLDSCVSNTNKHPIYRTENLGDD